jgi:hypothetical protein
VKIGIVIPLKSRQVARNWDVISKNLQATVNSVLAQNSNEYSAVVVGHDCPDFLNGDYYKKSKCEFIHYKDFEPPRVGQNEAENQLKYEFDRCTKILRGVMHLKENASAITHWFALDADDLIHDNFVTVLGFYKSADAIILDKGYFYFKNTGIINEENEFSAYCGSSAVISDQYFNLPEVVDEKSYKKIPFGGISHVHMKQRMVNSGVNVSVPDERLIMYVRDNGENISNDAYCNTFYKKLKKRIKMFLKIRFVGMEVKMHFGLD